MSMNESVPIKLLKEFVHRMITVETNYGEEYKGVLLDVEENMSLSLIGVKAKFINGTTVKMISVYIKGSCIRLISLPDSALDALDKIAREPPSRGRGRGGFRGGPKRGGGRKPPFSTRY